MDRIFVLMLLGSNIGDSERNVRDAAKQIEAMYVLHDVKYASLYKTEPVGFKEQEWFINTAVTGYTRLEPEDILYSTQFIESFIGRKVREKWREREIDIDIILYGNEIIKTEKLTIPHSRMHERRFVLVPACEIAAEAVHPVFKKSIRELLESCEDRSRVLKL